MTDADTTGDRRGRREWFTTKRALRAEVEQLRQEGEDLAEQLALARAAYDSARAENGDLWGQLQDAEESLGEERELRRLEILDHGQAIEWERTNGDLHRAMLRVARDTIERVVVENGEVIPASAHDDLERLTGRVERQLGHHADRWGDFDADAAARDPWERSRRVQSLEDTADQERKRTAQIRREQEGRVVDRERQVTRSEDGTGRSWEERVLEGYRAAAIDQAQAAAERWRELSSQALEEGNPDVARTMRSHAGVYDQLGERLSKATTLAEVEHIETHVRFPHDGVGARLEERREGVERVERGRTVADSQGATADHGLHRVTDRAESDAPYVAIRRGDRTRTGTDPDEGIVRSRGMTM
jgi:hypothetical protein